MADKFFGVGAVSTVASGNMTPTNPASLAVDDILICCLAQHDNVVATMPAGWTRVIAQNGTTTAIRLDSFWRRVTDAAESDDAVTVTRAAGDAGVARIVAFRGLTTSGNPHNAAASQANASSSTVTMTTVTPSAAGQTIVFVGAIGDDGAFAAVSGTDPAPTERVDNLTSLGLDASLLVATGERSVSTATGNRTSVNVRTNVNCGAQIALTTAAAGGITEADATATGVATATSIGAATVVSEAGATGVATGTGVGASVNLATASADGVAAGVGLTATVFPSRAVAAGVATPASVTATVWASVGASSGEGTALADAEDISGGGTIVEADAVSSGVATAAALAAWFVPAVAASNSGGSGGFPVIISD